MDTLKKAAPDEGAAAANEDELPQWRPASASDSQAGDSGPKTLRRGLQILDVLRAAGTEGLKITEISARTGIFRTTVYRFLDVLLEMHYVRELGPGRRFVLNVERFHAAHAQEARIETFKPILRRISQACGDSSFLVCRSGADSLCVHREIGSYPVQVLSVTIGHRQPMGVGAAGLALLASQPEGEIETVLQANANRLEKFGGMTTDQMRRLIRSTQERGWSVVGNAAVPGVLGVGVAVSNRLGRAKEFAISVSSMIDRMPAKRQREIIELITGELRQSGLVA